MTDIIFMTEPSAPAGLAPKARPNSCAHCGRPFGLVRHRLATRHLCSRPCLAAETERMQRALKDKVLRLAHLPGRG